MKLRCRAGDLALVIHDEPSCKANIGRVVRLEGPAAYSSYYARYCWLIFPVDDRPWLVMRDQGPAKVRIGLNDLIDHPDPWLMPLRTVDGFAAFWAAQRKMSTASLKKSRSILAKPARVAHTATVLDDWPRNKSKSIEHLQRQL